MVDQRVHLLQICKSSPGNARWFSKTGIEKCQATSSRSKTMSYKLADQFTQKELLVMEFVAKKGDFSKLGIPSRHHGCLASHGLMTWRGYHHFRYVRKHSIGQLPSKRLHIHKRRDTLWSNWWYTYPPEKLWKSDWIIIPTIGVSIKFHGSKPPTSDTMWVQWLQTLSIH